MSGTGSGSDALTSAVTSKTFTSFASVIDLLTEVPTGGAAPKRACRRVRINAVGASPALAIQYGDGSTDTITGLSAGDVLDVQASKILAAGTTGITSVTVFW